MEHIFELINITMIPALKHIQGSLLSIYKAASISVFRYILIFWELFYSQGLNSNISGLFVSYLGDDKRATQLSWVTFLPLSCSISWRTQWDIICKAFLSTQQSAYPRMNGMNTKGTVSGDQDTLIELRIYLHYKIYFCLPCPCVCTFIHFLQFARLGSPYSPYTPGIELRSSDFR